MFAILIVGWIAAVVVLARMPGAIAVEQSSGLPVLNIEHATQCGCQMCQGVATSLMIHAGYGAAIKRAADSKDGALIDKCMARIIGELAAYKKN